jgi:hypothetical protein
MALKGLAMVTALATLSCAVAGSSAPALGQDSQPASWHIIRPGDTLDGILARYYGPPSALSNATPSATGPTNAADAVRAEGLRLNPQVVDPDLIYPGKRLRLAVEPEDVRLPVARLESIGARVEELPRPVSWIAALEGDLLLEGDGVRTYDDASAQLRFGDGSSVAATENALLFVRRPRDAKPSEVVRVLEVVRGRADLEITARPDGASRFEVVLGDAQASGAVPSGAPSARSRVRNEEKGTAKLMMYSGDAAIAAQGARVEVPQGTGTSVPPGAPPRPAEPLLPAPRWLSPSPGRDLPYSNPILRWAEVAGAASYQVELCSDAACARVLELVHDVRATDLQARLARGPLFARVGALSASGLDGYLSPAVELRVTDETPDREPPVLSVRPGGYGQLPVVEARDERSGVVGIWFRLDPQGVERPLAELTLELAERAGGGLEFIARDAVGLEARSGALGPTRDTTAPEIVFEIVPTARGTVSEIWRDELHFDWSATSPGWLAWHPASNGRMRLPALRSRSTLGLEYAGDPAAPVIDFAATRRFAPADDARLAGFGPGESLRVTCRDRESGVGRCSVARAVSGGDGGDGLRLEVEATDRAGNSGRRSLVLH